MGKDKINIIQTVSFGIILAILTSPIVIFWQELSFKESKDMITDDFKKIKDALNHKVYYDYQFKSFKIDSNKLVKFIKSLEDFNKLNVNDPVKFLFVQFGFNKYISPAYSSFSMSFSGLKEDKNPKNKVYKMSLLGWNESSAINYNNAFNYLNGKGFIGTYGHRHKMDDGVIYPLDSASNFIKTHKAYKENYYLYPCIVVNSWNKANFTTIIISNDSLLREKAVSPLWENVKSSINYYGDKGSGCCN